jgi:hypothetical protein
MSTNHVAYWVFGIHLIEVDWMSRIPRSRMQRAALIICRAFLEQSYIANVYLIMCRIFEIICIRIDTQMAVQAITWAITV